MFSIRNAESDSKAPDGAAATLAQVVAEAGAECDIARAAGYAEALADLVNGMKNINSFALVSIEPTVRLMQKKAQTLTSHP